MSFEDDIIENGFSDGNDYIDYLMDEAESIMQREREREQQAEKYEEWLEGLSDEEIEELKEEKAFKKEKKEKELINTRRKQLNEERILKLWAKDNPQKALIWFANYRQSPDVRKADLDCFLSALGTSSIYINHYFDQSADLWNGYDKWKYWLEKYEAFQEFKEKAPDEYLELKKYKYSNFIESVALDSLMYCDDPYSYKPGFYMSYPSKRKLSYKTPKILNAWISDHPKLWREITQKYKSELKTEDDYLFQSWCENCRWRDYFTAWKIKYPYEWQFFKTECDAGRIIPEDTLQSTWLEEFKKDWTQTDIDTWNQYYNYHKKYLWSVYTEIQWLNFLAEKRAADVRASSKIDTDEEQDEQLKALIEKLERRRRIRDRAKKRRRVGEVTKKDYSCSLNANSPKYLFLEIKDPRYAYRFSTHEEEEAIYDIIIEKYEKELNENLEKRVFIEQNCTEKDFDSFVNRRKEVDDCSIYSRGLKLYIKIELTPEEYADLKILKLWVSQNKEQWDNWKYNLCWNQWWKESKYKVYSSLCIEDHYEIWTQLNAKTWNTWKKEKYVLWKRIAQNIDLWIGWLLDNNQLNFHEWASKHIKGWARSLHKAMKYELRSACQSLFNPYLNIEFNEWRRTNYNNWRYWKNAIFEQILIDEFSRDNIYSSYEYEPEYKLRLQIQEKLYQNKIGMNIFHENLAVIEKDEKYGYINKDGIIVIKPQYDDARPFHNGIAPVKIGAQDYKAYEPEIGSYMWFKIGGKWGFINTKGEMVVDPQFDSVRFADDDEMILFSKDGELDTNNDVPIWKNSKWGMMDANFHEVIPPKYDLLIILGNGFLKARKKVDKGYRWALLSNLGVELTPFKYSDIFNTGDCDDSGRSLFLANIGGWHDAENLASMHKIDSCYEGVWGYLDMDGNEIESFISADNAWDFWNKYSDMHNCSDDIEYIDTANS